MKLRTRFGMGLSVIALVTCGLGLFSLRTYENIHKEFSLLKKDVIPGALSMLETQAAVATFWGKVAEIVVSGDLTLREHTSEAIASIRENTAEHTARERHVGDEEGQVAQDMENRAARIISLGEQVMDAVKTGESQAEAQGFLRQMHVETEALKAVMEEHVAEHMSELAEAEKNVHQVYVTGRQTAWATMIVAVALSLGMGFCVARTVLKSVYFLSAAAENIGRGDLTVVVDVKSGNEIGALGAVLNNATTNLRQVIGGLRDDAVRLSTTAAELASSAEELTRTTAAQSDEINRTSTGVEEMAATIREVARNAELAAQAATAANQRAQAGGELVADTAGELERADEIMQRLRSRSDEIDTIVNLIQDVAAQTNILALNAAIEAAGAGAAGARFDVVAEEIRQLARRTSQATGEIAALIGAVQSDTETAAEAIARGAAIAKESGTSLTSIVEAATVVNDMMQGISTSTEQQSQTSEEIARSLDAVAGGSQHTVAATRETAQISVELSNLAERLKEAASQFKI